LAIHKKLLAAPAAAGGRSPLEKPPAGGLDARSWIFFPAPFFHPKTGPAESFAKPKQKPFKPIYGMKGCTRLT
jgi:hypothetical protein